jgi:hypothetical protein
MLFGVKVEEPLRKGKFDFDSVSLRLRARVTAVLNF